LIQSVQQPDLKNLLETSLDIPKYECHKWMIDFGVDVSWVELAEDGILWLHFAMIVERLGSTTPKTVLKM
jgi:hypothetical protein